MTFELLDAVAGAVEAIEVGRWRRVRVQRWRLVVDGSQSPETRQIECPLEHLLDDLPQATRHRLFLSSESSELILDTSENLSLRQQSVEL